jgi:hypothetical protein
MLIQTNNLRLDNMKEKTYECVKCGKRVKKSDDERPECCGKPMKQITVNICLQPAHAEHARTMENDEPCDDGRAG